MGAHRAPIVPIVMYEWSSVECDLDRSTAASLAQAPHGALAVTPCGQRWKLTAQNMVGVVHAGDTRVVIRPKIGMTNTLALLDVPNELVKWNAETFEYGDDADLLVALIRVFRRGLDRALAQGLRRDYREQREHLQSVRGRVDVATMIRHPGPVIPIPCRFDEYTADTRLNRVLAAAIRRSLRVAGVGTDDRVALMRHLSAFEGVGRLTGSLRWLEHWEPTRLDRHYEQAVRPAALILGNSTLVDRPGAHRAASFLVDMNRLVEAFITDRLRGYLQGLIEVEDQCSLHLDTDRRVPIRPDLVFRREGRPVFVADIKYKMFDLLDGERTADLYQLSAYCRVLGLGSGALISCIADRSPDPTGDRVTVQNSNTELHLWPVDLRGRLHQIEADIRRLADRIVESVLQHREP